MIETVKKKMNKKVIVFISAFILIAAIATTCIAINVNKPSKVSSQTEQKEQKTSSANVVTGTGVLEADQQQDVSAEANVMGKVISAPFEEGQQVHIGDLLYEIDHTDLSSNITKAELAVKQAQLAYDQTVDSVNKLTLRSGISGTITNLYIHDGDMVQQNAKMADVVDNDTMILKVPFIEETTNGIYVGQSATVSIIGSFYTVNGTVKKVTTGHLPTASNSVIKMVEISVPNPGSVSKGDKGTAIIGNVACNDAGIFDYSDYEAVYAEVAGKVNHLNKSFGDHVTSGEVITTLQSDMLTSQLQQNGVGVQTAKAGLDGLNDQLKKYRITSTVNGIAIKKTIDKDDIIGQANSTKMTVIADLSKIIFKMNVDELDVAKLQVGQTVSVTADAAPDKEYTGTIEFISESGTQTNGVSLYEVRVNVENPEGLMPGMNVSAKINLQ